MLSANLPIGMANMLTLGQAAFYGIGAYISAFFLMQFNLPFIVVALTVMLFTGVFSCIVSYASIKFKGDYFVLATLGFQMIVYTVLYNWTDITRGPYGISGIPSIKLFGIWNLSGVWGHFFLTTIISVAFVYLFKTIRYSPYGRVLRALCNDEHSVAAMGRNPTVFKSWAFFLSAAFSGLAGIIYASYAGYIDPSSFTLDESIFIISALFIGGTGKIRGTIFGLIFIIIFPLILKSIASIPDTIAANTRQIIYGLSLILVMFNLHKITWNYLVSKLKAMIVKHNK